ncbi:MAG: putative leader peptide [Pseudonocardiaceae bacterium]
MVQSGTALWHAPHVTAIGIRLVARRHVDFRRVSSAICRPAD